MTVKTTSEIRQAFIEYFKSKGHLVQPSGSLVPAQDPTLMFTNAGMVQFKNVFTGRQKRPAPCATTVQKCIRISGKHNDLENVGRTSRHHTFFEMLGNFSFGDYFKDGACTFGWQFLTEVLGLEKDKLWVSVFKGDDQAAKDQEVIDIWTQKLGVSPDRILEGSAKDNFWSMGETGPCGPCSEIMYDRGEAFGEASLANGERFFEIWNLVFMQYVVETPGGPLVPLPAPCIDTGAGLERIASVLQGVESNYDIDTFVPLVNAAAQLAGKTYGADAEDDVSMRVIADHARMAAHLISEGIFPEKTGREYVLRRVMRRAIRHGHRLGISELFFHKVADLVVDQMGTAYPELVERRDLIGKICAQEEERFRATLSRGLDLLAQNNEWATDDSGNRVLPGAIAFDLSATYGFPLDLVEVIGEEEGFLVDKVGFDAAQAAHKAASGAGKIGEQDVAPAYRQILDDCGKTEFLGYERVTTEAVVVGLVQDGVRVQSVDDGAVDVVLDKTVFYGESGGQVGDVGRLLIEGRALAVVNTYKPVDGLFVHHVEAVTSPIDVGANVVACIDDDYRRQVAVHHTATHLLHYAIRHTLGGHATQKGSKVTSTGLRFDFTHFEPVDGAKLARVEQMVNEMILGNTPVSTHVTDYEQARASGAMALFEENYGDKVRKVQVGLSVELCGGTHASASGDLGSFYVLQESGVAAGVRRIEAVCGKAALNYVNGQRRVLSEAAALLKAAPVDLLVKLEKQVARERSLVKEVAELKLALAGGGGADTSDAVKEIKGIKVMGQVLAVGDPSTLRDAVDTQRQKLGTGVVCLAGSHDGKAAIVVGVTRNLTKKLHAGQLIKEVVQVVGGRGGGRPDLAQAGGPDDSRLSEAVATIYQLVEKALS